MSVILTFAFYVQLYFCLSEYYIGNYVLLTYLFLYCKMVY